MNINELVESHVIGMEPDSILCDKGTETPQYNRDRLIEVGVYAANAVLKEIEKALKQAKLYSDLSCKSRLYDDLVNLVEQLKEK